MATKEKDNYIGSVVGGAIGDALGAPTEFMSLAAILEKYGSNGMNDYVEFLDGKGAITDDTQMLLFTAEGIMSAWHRAATKGIWGAHIKICYEAYLRWLHTQTAQYTQNVHKSRNVGLINEPFLYQRRAPGNTCLTALMQGSIGTMTEPINNSKGCGGIMRIAPIGLLLHRSPAQAFQIGAELAAITHGHPSGYLSAGYLCALIAYLTNGEGLINAIEKSSEILKKHNGYEETLDAIHKAINLYNHSQPSFQNVELLGGGWVAEEALSISLYCALCFENNFEKAINLSINHSGDTDSTGAITGNIVGLMVGEQGIPKRWIKNLSHYTTIKQIAIDLYTALSVNEYEQIDSVWERKYPPFYINMK